MKMTDEKVVEELDMVSVPRHEYLKLLTKYQEIEVANAVAVLPAWFTERMMSDVWFFGLLTTSGHLICISAIDRVSPDGQWLDVDLLEEGFDIQNLKLNEQFKNKMILAVGDRTKASVKVSEIVMAFELAFT